MRDTLALTGLTVPESLYQEELEKLLRFPGQVKGIGYGFDAGREQVVRNGNSQVVVGLAALDITGTTFTQAENENDYSWPITATR